MKDRKEKRIKGKVVVIVLCAIIAVGLALVPISGVFKKQTPANNGVLNESEDEIIQTAADTEMLLLEREVLADYFATDSDATNVDASYKNNVTYSYSSTGPLKMSAQSSGDFSGMLWLSKYYYQSTNVPDVSAWHSNMLISLKVVGPVAEAPTVMRVEAIASKKSSSNEIPIKVTGKYVGFNIDLTGWEGSLVGIKLSFLNGTSGSNVVYMDGGIVFGDPTDAQNFSNFFFITSENTPHKTISGTDLYNWGGLIEPGSNIGPTSTTLGLDNGALTATFTGDDSYFYYVPSAHKESTHEGMNIPLGTFPGMYSKMVIKYKLDFPNEYNSSCHAIGAQFYVVDNNVYKDEDFFKNATQPFTVAWEAGWQIGIVDLSCMGGFKDMKGSTVKRLRIDLPQESGGNKLMAGKNDSLGANAYGSKLWIEYITFIGNENISDYRYAYGLRYDTDGGSSIPGQSTDFTFDTSYNFTVTNTVPTKTAYNFTGWKNSKGTTVNAGSTITLNAGKVNEAVVETLTAQWTAKDYTITVNNEESTTPLGYTIEKGFTLPVVSKNHNKLVGWKVTAVSSESSFSVGDTILTGVNAENKPYGDITVEAQWEPVRYELTYDTNGGELSNWVIGTTASYTYYDEINIPKPTREHYTFKNWNVDVEKTDEGSSWEAIGKILGETTYEDQHGNVTLKAEWEAITYKLIFSSVEGVDTSNLTFDSDSQTYYMTYDVDENKIQSFPAITAPQYKEFSGFKVIKVGDVPASGEITTDDIKAIESSEKKLYGNITIEPYYTAKKLFEYKVVSELGGTVSTASGIIEDNGLPTAVKAIPSAGYRLVNWYEDEECTKAVNPAWVQTDGTLIPGAKENGTYGGTYYAKFEKNMVKVTLSVSGVENKESAFIFTITGTPTLEEFGSVNVTVIVTAESPQTILLPAGSYTITQNNGWSWKYEDKDAVTQVIDSNSERNLTITITQVLENN